VVWRCICCTERHGRELDMKDQYRSTKKLSENLKENGQKGQKRGRYKLSRRGVSRARIDLNGNSDKV